MVVLISYIDDDNRVGIDVDVDIDGVIGIPYYIYIYSLDPTTNPTVSTTGDSSAVSTATTINRDYPETKQFTVNIGVSNLTTDQIFLVIISSLNLTTDNIIYTIPKQDGSITIIVNTPSDVDLDEDIIERKIEDGILKEYDQNVDVEVTSSQHHSSSSSDSLIVIIIFRFSIIFLLILNSSKMIGMLKIIFRQNFVTT